MEPRTRLLRLPEVEQISGLKKSAIYLRAKDGSFPRPIKIGTRNVAWIESEVDGWVAERVAEARGCAA